jgi:tetratricopeptide (TPR) repeat protein
MCCAVRRVLPLCIMLVVTAGAVPLAGPQSGALSPADGWAALESGDASKAAAVFRDALDRSPRDAALHFGAGYAAFLLGRSDAALASLKKAVEYRPQFPQALVLLAQVAYGGGDLDLAIKSLEKAATLLPGEPRLRQQLEQWRGESALHNRFEERPGVRFRVLFEGAAEQKIGARVERVLEAAYWSVGKTLNSYPSETLTVILYTDRQFQDVTRAPAWAGGGFDGRIRLAVGGALRSPSALDRVVVHEFVHAVVTHAAPRGVPAWVNEGLASYLESTDRTWATRVLRDTSEIVPLEDLAGGFGRFDGPTAVLAYAESLVAAEILCARLGPNLGVFLQMLGSGHTVDQALSTLNVQPEAFHAEWRRRVGLD